jgi:hypothetical protein
MNTTPKRQVNTKICRPVELYTTIGRMLPQSTFRDAPQKTREFVHSLSVQIAKSPANYFKTDDAPVIDVHALASSGIDGAKFIQFVQEGISEDEYKTSWPLFAQAIERNRWHLIIRQTLGDVIEKASIDGWYEQIGRPLTVLTPKESRKYNWDQAIIDTGLKMGILLENLVKIRDACVACKRACAKPEELEPLHELSLSAAGIETAQLEISGFTQSIDAAVIRNARAFDASMAVVPTGKEVVHPFTRSY